MKVPFGTLNVNDKELLDKVVASNWLTQGETVAQFEKEFANVFKAKFAIACSTGTDALAICCATLERRFRGGEIIVPALTFVASANAIYQAGFIPRFVDVDRKTLGIDVSKIQEAITSKTVAIMPVHLMGKPCNMDGIIKLVNGYASVGHNITIIEDCCEAHGAEYKGRLVGNIGDMGCFSLYASHIVSSVEGGMIITDDPDIDSQARSLRNHGMINKFMFNGIGFSAKMNELEAAVGLGNIRNFDSILNHRIRNWKYLTHQMQQFKYHFILMEEESHEKIGPHAFSLLLQPSTHIMKDELCSALKNAEIDFRDLFYSIPTQTAEYIVLERGEFHEAEYCSNNGVHIGIHQDLTINQLDYVVSIIKALVNVECNRVPQENQRSI